VAPYHHPTLTPPGPKPKQHFLAYDLEDWNGTDRHHFNAIISEADAANYYLPAFQACVEDANVSSLMCSYQEINGVPACASSHYMKDIARGLWGFNGCTFMRARARTRPTKMRLLYIR